MSSPSRRGQSPSPHDGLPPPLGDLPLAILGRSLRRAREAKGLEAKDLSDRLRIGVEQLDALENGDRSRLPEAVFVLAQARRIAAALGADIDQELQALRSSGQLEQPVKGAETEAEPDAGEAAAARATGQDPAPVGRLRPLALLFTAALLLGGGGAALWLLQPFGSSPSLSNLGRFIPRFPAQPSAAPPPVPPPSDNSSAATAKGPAHVSPAAAPATVASLPLIPPLAAPTSTLPAAAGNRSRPVAPTAGTPAAQPAAPTNLVISAKGPSWLEVRDSKGRVLYRGLFAEERSFPLSNGLQVLAGRPDLVSTRQGAGPSRLLGTISEVRWQSFGSRP